MVGRVIVKARQVRLAHQVRLGRVVTLNEASSAMGIESAALSRIETNKTSGVDFSTLAKMCAYYGVQVCDLLSYSDDPAEEVEESIEDLALVA